MHISLVMPAAMHINLDNICFYDHPPAKPSSRALPSSWRAYNPSVGPQTLPRALSPRSHSYGNLISGAGVGVFSQSQAPAREQTDLCAGSEFDFEIQRSLTQNNQVADETDLGRYLNHPGLQDEDTIDVHPGGQTSPVSDDFPLRDTLGDLDISSTNKDPQSSRPGQPLALDDLLGWRRDSISPLATHNETDKGPLSPESSLGCPRIFSTPPPDLPVRPSIETSLQGGSIVGDTEREENSGDRTGSPEDEVVAPSAQVNAPSTSEALSEEDAIGRLTKDSHTSVTFCLASQTRSTIQSQATLVKTPSPQLRRNLRSTRHERFPAVSVVIPTRRNDELVARTRENRRTASKRHRHRGSSDKDRETQRPMDDDHPPRSDERNSKTGGRSPKQPKRAKRAKKNHLPSGNIVGERCANQPQESSEGGAAFILGKTEEIFGRGVLRIQANGPRYAYFMTFLPEVSRHPSMPPEASHGQSSRDENLPENSITRRVGRRKRTRSMSTGVGEKRDGRPTEMLRSSWSCEGDNENQKKPRRRLRWSSEEVDYLKGLRSDGRRPWSEVTRLFLVRYPGRSPAAIQVYCSTHRL
ncbi:hypothetical protein N7481_003465 [Penicillium waksmanii]|uniref:uncharacterized protein n=1 Tax=Penicillium waksmanii TaxID=69791 RepID=UPI0025486295|nr:uncharacterized protein N7481_003465 [Penicillium waksmanii]KAJ5988255.1 hypothetical protein N7481_003465 [Penicillium waksmanii]